MRDDVGVKGLSGEEVYGRATCVHGSVYIYIDESGTKIYVIPWCCIY